METNVLPVDDGQPAAEAVEQAARLIRAGQLVAFPTETVYGLGADALNEAACREIYAAKQRAATDPCIVHIAELEQLERLTSERPVVLETLATRFWPGPLSLVVPKSRLVPDVITAGTPTVAVRMPAHAVAAELIQRARTPIAAPSANLFGHTSPTTAQHVLDDLGGRIPLVLDAGPCAVGVESTVLDLTSEPPRLLRPGGVTLEQLREVLGEVLVAESAVAEEERQTSPGQLSRHYAPSVPLRVFDGPAPRALAAMQRAAQELAGGRKTVGVLLANEDQIDLPDAVRVVRLGGERDLDAIAQRLFAAIRELEGAGVSAILTRTFETSGRGLAIADRLRRASAGNVKRLP
ncbi:MAG: threonylcarbamoyl-AMP synthase [Chloroflexi bacterium]|nr:threonylcarbamoyl-AMP synthase [Chloroflexota bacterium]